MWDLNRLCLVISCLVRLSFYPSQVRARRRASSWRWVVCFQSSPVLTLSSPVETSPRGSSTGQTVCCSSVWHYSTFATSQFKEQLNSKSSKKKKKEQLLYFSPWGNKIWLLTPEQLGVRCIHREMKGKHCCIDPWAKRFKFVTVYVDLRYHTNQW